MDKRGDTSIALESILFIAICILVFLGMLYFINVHKNERGFYEDFYAKEISGLINDAKPGMEYKLDVSKLAAIAIKNGKPVGDIISIDNVNNQIVVSTMVGSGTVFSFYNDIDIVDWDVTAPSGSSESTRFIFKTKEKQRNDF